MIESCSISEHSLHVRHIAHVPVTDVFIKVTSIVERLRHIRHLRNVPIADVTVGVSRVRFVRKPQIHRVLKIGVGDRFVSHEFRPVGRPVLIRGERFVEKANIDCG